MNVMYLNSQKTHNVIKAIWVAPFGRVHSKEQHRAATWDGKEIYLGGGGRTELFRGVW